MHTLRLSNYYRMGLCSLLNGCRVQGFDEQGEWVSELNILLVEGSRGATGNLASLNY
jgi:hypothetical protein